MLCGLLLLKASSITMTIIIQSFTEAIPKPQFAIYGREVFRNRMANKLEAPPDQGLNAISGNVDKTEKKEKSFVPRLCCPKMEWIFFFWLTICHENWMFSSWSINSADRQKHYTEKQATAKCTASTTGLKRGEK